MKNVQLTTKQIFIAQMIVSAIYFTIVFIRQQMGIFGNVPVSIAFLVIMYVLLFIRKFFAVDRDTVKPMQVGWDVLGIPQKYRKKAEMISYILFFFLIAVFLWIVIPHYYSLR